MDKDPNLDLSPDNLARLLGITYDAVSDEPKDSAADTDTQFIEAQLAGTLALDMTVLDRLPAVIGQLDKDIFPGGGKALGEVLTNPESDLEIIGKIKRFAKKLSSQEKSGAQHDVAVAVYYAAIAGALLFHKMKITTHSDETLKAMFEKFSSKPWMSKELARLFAKAAKTIR